MFRTLLVAFILTFSVARAAEAPASEASVRELLQITEAKKLLDGMIPQMEAMMRSGMQQALQGRTFSAEEQRALDGIVSKVPAMIREEFNWEKLEPIYLRIYQKFFTQEEIDSTLAFYRSPVGAALIKKMPLVMTESIAAMQDQMGPMLQKMQKVMQEGVAEIIEQKKKR